MGWDCQFITFRYCNRENSSSRRIGTEGELIKIPLKIRYFIIRGCFGKFLDEILFEAVTHRPPLAVQCPDVEVNMEER
jgi:hypothetical protein